MADYADGRPGGAGVDSWYAISNAARTAGLALSGLVTGIVVADGSTAGYRAVAYGAAVFLALAAALVAVGVRAPHRAATAPTRRLPRAAARPALPRARRAQHRLRDDEHDAGARAADGGAHRRRARRGSRRCCWPRTPCSSRCCRRRSCAGSPACAAPAASRAPPGCGCSGAACSRSSASPVGSTATVVLVVGTLLFTVAEAVHAPISTAAAAGAAPAAARGRLFGWVPAASSLHCTSEGIHRMKNSIQLLLVMLLVFAVFPVKGSAQATASGTIQGTVTDPSGAVVVGAQVQATQRSTGTVRTTSSSDSGSFRFDLLQRASMRSKSRRSDLAHTCKEQSCWWARLFPLAPA